MPQRLNGWVWRKSSGFYVGMDREAGMNLFHACDFTGHIACERSTPLNGSATGEVPGRNSLYCQVCAEVAENENGTPVALDWEQLPEILRPQP